MRRTSHRAIARYSVPRRSPAPPTAAASSAGPAPAGSGATNRPVSAPSRTRLGGYTPPMHALAIVFALTSLITNPRVAVTDGTDTGTRSHDTVIVDVKSASARFVKAG